MRAIYLWQHKDWPRFHWDAERLLSLLGEVHSLQGQLLGRMSALGFEGVQRHLDTLTEEIVGSSRIEGVELNRDSVRSSVARHLGVTLDEDAFYKCAGMTELTLPSTVTNIGDYAFERCQNLTKLTIKAGSIGKDAFEDCTNVTDVTFLGVVVLNYGSLSDIGTAESPVALKIPSAWLANDKPVNSTTPWHGGYFNCTYTDPVKEFLGEMDEPCEDCPAIEVTKGDKTIKLYNPEKVNFIKVSTTE